MNKEQLIIILQSCLFSFEGASKEEILDLNPNYDIEAVRIGCKLNKYLKGF